jgi:hypothetical protein
LWLNLLFLLSISFIPFPTDLLGEYGELRFAVIFYAVSLALARLLLALVWWYVFSGPIRISDELDRGLAKFHLLRSLAIPAIFLLSIGIAFFSTDAAISSWVVLVAADPDDPVAHQPEGPDIPAGRQPEPETHRPGPQRYDDDKGGERCRKYSPEVRQEAFLAP